MQCTIRSSHLILPITKFFFPALLRGERGEKEGGFPETDDPGPYCNLSTRATLDELLGSQENEKKQNERILFVRLLCSCESHAKKIKNKKINKRH